MNIKLFNVALGVALTATAFSASAQKKYTEGVVSFSTEMRGQPAEVKEYFNADSTAALITMGPANVKILSNAKHDFFAVVLDVPVAGIKKAGIATPAEVEEAMSQLPSFTFTPGTETKQISGFNCKKVTAKDTKSGKAYDVWITNDFTVPETAMPVYYKQIGGFPVQYTAFQQGQETSITITSIADTKAPAGTFGIGKDYTRGSMADLSAQ
ncbi:DUF4412 domain-containing protein [Mucilaginibacter xinganensis]|uniref:Uncharacterized protein n=1 Tax=Mucilaginibacter xinganensis TaxID=1234841 RepID=A0A223NX73_9SPHI|nr:DUF4412 domain-containing protein [Mucilaginibacter xinganensis]ASU34294.1 hypothetical protein MuYL_2407 [Mucilaginibacter xinganensis]